MKNRLLFTGLILLLTACHQKQDDPATVSFDASVQSIGGDCRLPLLDFGLRTAEVKTLTGSTSASSLYYAINLDPAYSKAGTTLQVTIRKVAATEERACTTMGPAYASVAVSSAAPK